MGNEKLNQHIIQLSISWVLALHSKDYKLNETGGCLGVGASVCFSPHAIEVAGGKQHPGAALAHECMLA